MLPRTKTEKSRYAPILYQQACTRHVAGSWRQHAVRTDRAAGCKRLLAVKTAAGNPNPVVSRISGVASRRWTCPRWRWNPPLRPEDGERPYRSDFPRGPCDVLQVPLTTPRAVLSSTLSNLRGPVRSRFIFPAQLLPQEFRLGF